jgi:hypothetical protein
MLLRAWSRSGNEETESELCEGSFAVVHGFRGVSRIPRSSFVPVFLVLVTTLSPPHHNFFARTLHRLQRRGMDGNGGDWRGSYREQSEVYGRVDEDMQDDHGVFWIQVDPSR